MTTPKAPIDRCSRCVMDALTDPAISFDADGYCNHCVRFLGNREKFIYRPGASDEALERLIHIVKREGRDKKFDCVLGISGGIDSSHLALLTKQWGLRPLAVHMDNGWNSKIAVSNIKKLLQTIGVELYTHVLDWEEFKDLQLSFFKASVADVENPTDMAIPGVLHRVARKFGAKFILMAGNYATEGMTPKHFQYGKKDLYYLRAIHRRFGRRPLKNFPSFGFWDEVAFKALHGIRILYPLNLVDYKKEEALTVLKRDFGWEDYGGKHHESIFTKFVQSYYLPVKFGIDYRKSTYSAMICNGQLSRREALQAIAPPPYKEGEISRDISYVAKKLGIPEEEFVQILRLPPKNYSDYPNAERFLTTMYGIYIQARDAFRRTQLRSFVREK